MFEAQKVAMAQAMLNALGTILSAQFNSSNWIGPGVRNVRPSTSEYPPRPMLPTKVNTQYCPSRQMLRYEARQEAKAYVMGQRLLRRNAKRKAAGLPAIKSLATCKKNVA